MQHEIHVLVLKALANELLGDRALALESLGRATFLGEPGRFIAAGIRNQEIADHLFISLHTLKRHIANAYGKLGVSHRTEAVARANELKLFG